MKLRKVKADSKNSCYSNGKLCEFDKNGVCTQREHGIDIHCSYPESITFQRVEDDPVKTLTLKKYALKIAWADLQDPKKEVNENKMKKVIGVGWHNKDCPYCEKYSSVTVDCYDCPLCVGKTLKRCCNGLWYEMNMSKTWGEWVINARKLVKYIKENG